MLTTSTRGHTYTSHFSLVFHFTRQGTLVFIHQRPVFDIFNSEHIILDFFQSEICLKRYRYDAFVWYPKGWWISWICDSVILTVQLKWQDIWAHFLLKVVGSSQNKLGENQQFVLRFLTGLSKSIMALGYLLVINKV